MLSPFPVGTQMVSYTDNMEGCEHWEDTDHMTDTGEYRRATGSLR